jgi:hypothetical protein
MQRCSCPLAKLSCIQNDQQLNLGCIATPLIYAACKRSASYAAPEQVLGTEGHEASWSGALLNPIPRDDMSDVISKKWNWNELRDEYRFGDMLPANP